MANPLLLEYLGVPITETDGPPTHFLIVVVGAATGAVGATAGAAAGTGAVGAVTAGAVTG